jgi:diguanylate cyclase (GGDEF)-like protein
MSLPHVTPELRRSAALAHYDVLQQVPDQDFERIVRLVAQYFGTATASISFQDEGRQWIRAAHGSPSGIIDGQQALCRVVDTGSLVCAPDTALDPRFARHPAVLARPALRFFASAPLTTPDGLSIGALCIADLQPRLELSPEDRAALVDFATLVMHELDLRVQTRAANLDVQARRHYAQDLGTALDLAQTLLGIADLAELALEPAELALRASELLTTALKVDWGGLGAVRYDLSKGHHATIVTAGQTPLGADLARQAAHGRQLAVGSLLTRAALSADVTFVDDYPQHPLAHPDLVQAGVQAVLGASLGRIDDQSYVLIMTRLTPPSGSPVQGWTKQERQMIVGAARSVRQMLASRINQLALQRAQTQQALTLQAGPLVLWATDRTGVFTHSEGRGLREIGIDPGAAVGRRVEDVYGTNSAVVENVRRALSGETFSGLVNAGGQVFEASYQPLRGESGAITGSLGVAYNVTVRVQAEAGERRARLQAEALMTLSLVLDADQDSKTLPQSAMAALTALAPTLEQAILILWQRQDDVFLPLAWCGALPPELDMAAWPNLPAERLDPFEVLIGRRTFVDRPGLDELALSLGLRGLAFLPVLVGSGNADMLLQVCRTGTFETWTPAERQLLEAATRVLMVWRRRSLDRQALELTTKTDALTGLGNRRAFEADLRTALNKAVPTKAATGVLLVDLDGMKTVNDTEGHARGDQLLRVFATALERSFRSGDRVYRLGGDEYVLLLPHASQADRARLMNRVAQAVTLVRDQGFAGIGASAGLACFPDDGATSEVLLRLSDERMYQHKLGKRRRTAAP